SPGPQDASFAAENSFVNAPLNSRLNTAPTREQRDKAPPLRDLSLEIQEALILEDMLSVLLGIEGVYIIQTGVGDPAQFTVDAGLDPALRDLVGRMLPIATHYCATVAFAEARAHIEFGSVCHALCAAVRSVLKDYTTLVTQLEHLFHTSPAFSLQQLWFHIHPALRNLSLIHDIADNIVSPRTASLTPSSSAASDDEQDEEERRRDEELGLGGVKAVLMGVGAGIEEAGSVKGGEVLGILWDRWVAMSGDPPASALLRTLLSAASAPYAQILRTWTHHGTLHDPHGEFFVRARVGAGEVDTRGKNKEDYTDEYWERRYTLRDGSHAPHPSTAATSSTTPSALSAAPPPSALVPRPRVPGGRLPGGACVPPPLESWKHKVLLAGKYLNVVREWGGDAAGVRNGLKELEDKERKRREGQENENDRGDGEGTERGASRMSNRRLKESTAGKSKSKASAEDSEADDGAMDSAPFYRSVEDAYTYANRTLLKVLMEDQMLIPRLRSLKYYFFLPRSSFLTHFLDLAHLELRKPPKSANLVKLQSLLELAISGPEEPAGFGSAAVVAGVGGNASGPSGGSTIETPSFREDVKVSMASSGLYEWLLKVVSVSGAIDDGGGEDQFAASRKGKGKDGKEDKKKKAAPALDHLTLDYTVPFPLSLVISRKTILRYQLLFRFLLHLKHVEQMLGGMWVEQMLGAWRRPVTARPAGPESRSVSRAESRASHHSGPPSAHPTNPGAQSSLPNTVPNPNHPHSSHYPTSLHADFERWRRRVFLLRARMLAFIQQILAFATFEVLEPNWRALEKRLERVVTVDQVLRDHVDFLDTCLKECMLTSAKLLRVYSNLLVTISMFAQYASSFTRSARDILAALDQEGNTGGKTVNMQKEWSFLSRFEQNFNHSFRVHLDVVSFYASSENVTLLSLVTRLNSVRSMQ
ncbi:hypothetical protein FRC10_012286, partial [Ceratobasidium sp. 414]